MKGLLIILLILPLTGCTMAELAWSAISPSKGGGVTVDTELVNGDKDITAGDNTKINSNEGTVNTTKNANEQVITGNGEVIIENSIPIWVYLTLIVGWMAPSPSVIYAELLRLINRE